MQVLKFKGKEPIEKELGSRTLVIGKCNQAGATICFTPANDGGKAGPIQEKRYPVSDYASIYVESEPNLECTLTYKFLR